MRSVPRPLVVVTLVALAQLNAHAVTTQQAVGQISQTSFQSYLSGLPVHIGDNRGFDVARAGGMVIHGNQHDIARDLIFTAFRRSGWLTSIDPFSIHDTSGNIWAGENVVAVKQGNSRPDDIYLVGAHYDSKNNPGANDNGTGVAGLLEMSRVLSRYTFDATIVFAAFDGEEVTAYGADGATYRRIGSVHYARAHAGDNIQAMISYDMVGWNDGSNTGKLETGYSQNADLNSQITSALRTYGGLNVASRNSRNYGDHVSFANMGFPALMLIENNWASDPCYHTANDAYETAGNIDIAYSTRMLKSLTGWLCDVAVINGLSPPYVPEPGSVVSLLAGIAGVALLSRRRGR